MKRYFAFTSLLVIMMLAASTQLMAQNADPDAVEPDDSTQVVVLGLGQSTGDIYLEDDGLIRQDKDIILAILQGAGGLHVEVWDAFILGDTIIAILLAPDASGTWGVIGVDWATSPDVAVINVSNIQGLALLISGYLACPGGFPAGYYANITH